MDNSLQLLLQSLHYANINYSFIQTDFGFEPEPVVVNEPNGEEVEENHDVEEAHDEDEDLENE